MLEGRWWPFVPRWTGKGLTFFLHPVSLCAQHLEVCHCGQIKNRYPHLRLIRGVRIPGTSIEQSTGRRLSSVPLTAWLLNQQCHISAELLPNAPSQASSQPRGVGTHSNKVSWAFAHLGCEEHCFQPPCSCLGWEARATENIFVLPTGNPGSLSPCKLTVELRLDTNACVFILRALGAGVWQVTLNHPVPQMGRAPSFP